MTTIALCAVLTGPFLTKSNKIYHKERERSSNKSGPSLELI